MIVFTTGQVAKLCGVAPRTASKWFDSGRLKGFNVPCSQDRRVPKESLLEFLKAHGMHVYIDRVNRQTEPKKGSRVVLVD